MMGMGNNFLDWRKKKIKEEEVDFTKELPYWLGFSLVAGLGPVTVKKAFELEPDPEKLWHSSKERLQNFFSNKIVNELIKVRNSIDLTEEIAAIQAKNISCRGLSSPDYPNQLLEIASPPLILFIKGIFNYHKPAIAIVGSRNSTNYGREIARELASELASLGIVIVSGLAQGIDRAAHEGAISAGGESWAVLGSGHNYQYPAQNKDLYQQLLEKGALISEFPPDIKPLPQNFPRRNRIISGLSQGVIVVEAAQRSGSLITARLASEQNRAIMAVPGNVGRPTSTGTNKLIADSAARLITSARDVIEEVFEPMNMKLYDFAPSESQEEKQEISIIPPGLTPAEKKILNIFTKENELTLNQLATLTNIGIAGVNASLVNLEVRGLIVKGEGQKYYYKGLQK